jgi:hypothetical protein
MTGRVLANAGVFALGLVLIVGGAWGIWRGSDYIQLERGWAAVISGSVAATGGVLTLAIGFVLARLDALQRSVLRAGAVTVPQPQEIAPEPLAEPMPLGAAAAAPAISAVEPQAALYEPHVASPEPQPGAEPVDPAVMAVAAINLELLDREERRAGDDNGETPALPEAHEVASTGAPREVVHAADQGPADDMVKAAGVSDEPELDAAIEQLLAEERAQGAPAEENLLASGESVPAATEEPTAAPPPRAEDTAPEKGRASGWRGLFSRKERRATPAADQEPTEPALEHPPEPTDVEAGRYPEAELEPAPAEQTPVAADAIPRTGDDWFDRALSGVDEVDVPDQRSSDNVAEGEHAASYEDAAGPEPAAHAQGPDEPAPVALPAPEPAVIGRYTSGNTTYVMFADGSIEAETPSGILHFASLADLKVYVEGGGT